MSILATESPAAALDEDLVAIEALRRAFEAQRRAFASDLSPDPETRRARIEKIIVMMLVYRGQIAEALAADFGAHPAPASDLLEVLGVVGRAQYVMANLETWMAAETRDIDPASFGTAQASIRRQPKGVIGNIVPWNFPFDIGVGPLTEMLAAGNRVIIKPSEVAPRSAALLAEMIAATFEPELVHVAVGGLSLARAFSALPWDHLMYTGSPDVGRQVMAAAAANLTPVTLELGGKCPAVMTPGSVNAANVASVIGTKIIKNGQMCVSVDYCLVPRTEVATFIDLAQAFMASNAPDYSRGPDCTGIVSQRHLDRLNELLAEARTRQTRLIVLEAESAIDSATRCMPMVLAVDPDADLRIMREEIFGPILPVIPYDDLQTAIDEINAGDRPLGLYVFSDDATIAARVLEATHSGGAAVNTCAIQAALPSLGFGGIGTSGMGRHHGIEGFREFSNPRGVVVRGSTGDLIQAFYAPYTTAAAVVEAVLAG